MYRRPCDRPFLLCARSYARPEQPRCIARRAGIPARPLQPLEATSPLCRWSTGCGRSNGDGSSHRRAGSRSAGAIGGTLRWSGAAVGVGWLPPGRRDVLSVGCWRQTEPLPCSVGARRCLMDQPGPGGRGRRRAPAAEPTSGSRSRGEPHRWRAALRAGAGCASPGRGRVAATVSGGGSGRGTAAAACTRATAASPGPSSCISSAAGAKPASISRPSRFPVARMWTGCRHDRITCVMNIIILLPRGATVVHELG